MQVNHSLTENNKSQEMMKEIAAFLSSALARSTALCHFFVKKIACHSVTAWEFKLHLEETKAARVEAVFSFPFLQRQKLYQLDNKLGVWEIFIYDLFTLRDKKKEVFLKH